MPSSTVQVALSSVIVTVISLLLFFVIWEVLHTDISGVKTSLKDLSENVAKESEDQSSAITNLYLSMNRLNTLGSTISRGLIEVARYSNEYLATGEESYFEKMKSELASTENAVSQSLSLLDSMLSSSANLSSSSSNLVSSLVLEAKSNLNTVQSLTYYLSSMNSSSFDSVQLNPSQLSLLQSHLDSKITSLQGLISSLEKNLVVSNTFISESGDLVLGGLDTTWSSQGVNFPSSDEWSLSLKSNEVLELSTNAVQFNAGDFSVSLSSDGNFLMNDGFSASVVGEDDKRLLIDVTENSIEFFEGVFSISPTNISVVVDDTSSLNWTGENWNLQIGETSLNVSSEGLTMGTAEGYISWRGSEWIADVSTVEFPLDNLTVSIGSSSSSSYMNWSKDALSVGFEGGGAFPALLATNESLQFGEIDTFVFQSGKVSFTDAQGHLIPVSFNTAETLTNSSTTPLSFSAPSVTILVDSGSSRIHWGEDSFGLSFDGSDANSFYVSSGEVTLTASDVVFSSDQVTVSIGDSYLNISNDSSTFGFEGGTFVNLTDRALSFSEDNVTLSVGNGTSYINWTDNGMNVGFDGGSVPALSASNEQIVLGTELVTIQVLSDALSLTNSNGIEIVSFSDASSITVNGTSPFYLSGSGATSSDLAGIFRRSGGICVSGDSTDEWNFAVFSNGTSNESTNAQLVIDSSTVTFGLIPVSFGIGAYFDTSASSTVSGAFEYGSPFIAGADNTLVAGLGPSTSFEIYGSDSSELLLSLNSSSTSLSPSFLEFTSNSVTLTVDGGSSYINWNDDLLSVGFVDGASPAISLSQSSVAISGPSSVSFFSDNLTLSVDSGASYVNWTDSSMELAFEDAAFPILSLTNDLIEFRTRTRFENRVEVGGTYPIYLSAEGAGAVVAGSEFPVIGQFGGGIGIVPDGSSPWFAVMNPSGVLTYSFSGDSFSLPNPIVSSSDTPLQFSAPSVTLSVDNGSSYVHWGDTSFLLGFEGGSNPLSVTDSLLTVNTASQFNDGIAVQSGSSTLLSLAAAYSFTSDQATFAAPLTFSTASTTIAVDDGSSYISWDDSTMAIGFVDGSTPVLTVSNDSLQLGSSLSTIQFSMNDVTLSLTDYSYINWTDSSVAVGFIPSAVDTLFGAGGSSAAATTYSLSTNSFSLPTSIVSSSETPLQFTASSVTLTVDNGSSYVNWGDTSFLLGFEGGSNPLSITDSLLTVNTSSSQFNGGVIVQSNSDDLLTLSDDAGISAYSFTFSQATFASPLSFSSASTTVSVDNGSSYISWDDSTMAIGFVDGSTPVLTVSNDSLQLGSSLSAVQFSTNDLTLSLTDDASSYINWTDSSVSLGFAPSAVDTLFGAGGSSAAATTYSLSTNSFSLPTSIVSSSETPLQFTASSVTLTVDGGSSYVNWGDTSFLLGFEGGSNPVSITDSSLVVNTASSQFYGGISVQSDNNDLLMLSNEAGTSAYSFTFDQATFAAPLAFSSSSTTVSVDNGSSYISWDDSTIAIGFMNGSDPALTVSNDSLQLGSLLSAIQFSSDNVTLRLLDSSHINWTGSSISIDLSNTTYDLSSDSFSLSNPIVSSSETPVEFTASSVTLTVDGGTSYVNWGSGNFEVGLEGGGQPSLSVSSTYLNTNGVPVVPSVNNYTEYNATIGDSYTNPSPDGIYLLNFGVGESSSTSSGLLGFQLSADSDYKFLYPNTSSGISYWSTILLQSSDYSFSSLSGVAEPSSILVKAVRLC
ncbi:hypothetical protein GpartN1_g1939.t1 [Galdieria partita]|uniref:Uncharacterized protein n=1 Tax=Galdieria partita TaxID=83374 RepID=A0A9C7UNT9_9RHOD|nr:hypothetical protein GpartN1_g1924.t1 [Galdieria partita]GJQ10148.1 hypothetical protein GpartN1_g1939.t1 [Galdieria partita]